MKRLLHEIDLGNNTFEVVICLDEIEISVEEIELLLGYQPKQIPAHFNDLIKTALSDLHTKINIKAGYRILKAEYKQDYNDGLFIGEKFFNLQKIVTGVLKKSENVAVFSLTIGAPMETKSKELLKNGDLVHGYIYDAVASVTVEACADVLHDHITEKMLLANQKATNRYSPGYCNWNVKEQHLLFSHLPENFCGISLTESALMTPIKSISGIIGVGEKVKYSEYSCNDCNIKDCTYRTITERKRQKIT